jgi:SulP family sulfate permease
MRSATDSLSPDARAAGPLPEDRLEPKLISVMREGYSVALLRRDALAGLTVAIVALPLSMAIAIASGASPSQGLLTAIVGGAIVACLGGSRHQIAGPAGAFIVLVAATLAAHGPSGLMLATLMSGLMLVAAGVLRLGRYIRYIPYPVIVGFTTGIGLIILASQIAPLLGLRLEGPEPGPVIPKLMALGQALPTLNPMALGVSLSVVALILTLRRLRPGWPGMLIAVSLATLICAGFSLPVDTVRSRFGALAGGVPMPALPPLDFNLALAVLPDAFAFALLGAIESLLSAVVADGMTGRRHRSDMELVAQGVANVVTPLFGGLSVTGTIARTATNVRAGAHGPVSALLHSAFLLVFLLVAAPVMGAIPLAALAGVLVVVAWNMIERHAMAVILATSRADAVVLIATLSLTVLRDLTEGIVVGFALGAMVFIHRMTGSLRLEADHVPDPAEPLETGLDANADGQDTLTYRLSGAFFFAAAARATSVLERLADGHTRLVLDLSGVTLLDSTGAQALVGFARRCERRGVALGLTGTDRAQRRLLMSHGLPHPLRHFRVP